MIEPSLSEPHLRELGELHIVVIMKTLKRTAAIRIFLENKVLLLFAAFCTYMIQNVCYHLLVNREVLGVIIDKRAELFLAVRNTQTKLYTLNVACCRCDTEFKQTEMVESR